MMASHNAVPSTSQPQAEPPVQADPIPSNSHPEPKPKRAPGFFQRLLQKLKPPTLSTAARARAASAPPLNVSSGPSAITGGRLSKSSALPNDWTSKERRDAALRERGLLVPPPRDLSQVERELDQRYTKVVPLDSSHHGESAAQKIKQQWKAENATAITDGGYRPGAVYPKTLGKPDFSRSRVTVDNEVEEQYIPEQPSTAPSDYSPLHIPDTSHPSLCKDHSKSGPTGCTEEVFSDAHSIDNSAHSFSIPTSQSPRANRPPIVITTTSPRQSLIPDLHPPLFINRSPSFPSLTAKRPSISTESNLPALSPTQTSSSFSSTLQTPQDEWGDSGAIIRTGLFSSGSATPSHQLGGVGSGTMGQDVTTDTTDQTNGEYPIELGGFEAYVERRENRKKQKSTGVFSNKSSGDYSRSTHSAGCGSIDSCAASGEFTGSASSPGCLGGPQAELQQKKSFRRTIFRLASTANKQKLAPPSVVAGGGNALVRKPTVSAALQSRGNILNQMSGVEDEESRRLSEMAFLDF